MSSDAVTKRMDKSPTVLWAGSQERIMLHNFNNGVFIELECNEQIVWERLDGTHTAAQIIRVLQVERGLQSEQAVAIVEDVIERLSAGDFLVY